MGFHQIGEHRLYTLYKTMTQFAQKGVGREGGAFEMKKYKGHSKQGSESG